MRTNDPVRDADTYYSDYGTNPVCCFCEETIQDDSAVKIKGKFYITSS